MSEIKVNSIKGVGASTAAITIDNTAGTCTANITNNLSNRNLIINGAMQVAQRGTSATVGDNSYATVDRFKLDQNSLDEDVTQAQVDVASGTTPYTSGFRKAFKITNGNQSGGAESSDRITIIYLVESQDMATSGWNYLSSSSYITLSYWVKSSVAQNFYNTFKNDDGTSQRYVTETGSLSADTWTKITKTIPGNSNLTFNNDNGEGLEITWELFRGTDQTGTRPLNAWAAADNATRTPDQTSTWYTTDDATFEITGVQLEVGSVATDFEHTSFKDELRRCQRYFTRIPNQDASSGYAFLAQAAAHDTNSSLVTFHFPVFMRSNPSMSTSGSFRLYNGGGIATTSIVLNTSNVAGATLQVSTSSGIDRYEALVFGQNNDSNAAIDFTAEL